MFRCTQARSRLLQERLEGHRPRPWGLSGDPFTPGKIEGHCDSEPMHRYGVGWYGQVLPRPHRNRLCHVDRGACLCGLHTIGGRPFSKIRPPVRAGGTGAASNGAVPRRYSSATNHISGPTRCSILHTFPNVDCAVQIKRNFERRTPLDRQSSRRSLFH
jgi:hypothetical protein